MGQEQHVEEKHETHKFAKPKGVRLWLSLALVALGVAMVAAGAFKAVSGEGVRIVLIVLGVLLIFGFGYVAVGGRIVKVKKSQDGGLEAGVELPQEEEVSTTTVHTSFRKRGLPKHGMMPPKHGTMPPKEGDVDARKPSDPGSGGR